MLASTKSLKHLVVIELGLFLLCLGQLFFFIPQTNEISGGYTCVIRQSFIHLVKVSVLNSFHSCQVI